MCSRDAVRTPSKGEPRVSQDSHGDDACPQRLGQSVTVEKPFNFVCDGPFQKHVDVETSFKGVVSQMKR